MSRVHIELLQTSRYLGYALRPAFSQRTIRIRPFPFISLDCDAMPQ